MANALKCSVDRHGDGTGVIHLGGRLDITSAVEAKRLFTEMVLGGTCRLVVDLEGLDFIDSSGLSALVSGLRASRQAGGDLRIAAAGQQPATILSLTSLDQVFRLYPDVAGALHEYTR